MKKLFQVCLIVPLAAMLLGASGCTVQNRVIDPSTAAQVQIGTLAMPEFSAQLSMPLAMQILGLCSGQTKEASSSLIESAGFNVIAQNNFDKSDTCAEHTCAYSVGSSVVDYQGQRRNAFLVIIRGTYGGEWYSNMDFVPSRSEELCFVENFLFTAQDVFLNVREYMKDTPSPVVIIGGHSRGGACANLLGLFFNELLGKDNVIDYTFASPTTVSAGLNEAASGNIFNFINPCDLVTKLPPEAWGYRRAGIDITLESDDTKESRLYEALDSINNLAPNIGAYYKDRHSLNEAGLDDTYGLALYDVMTLLAIELTKLTNYNAPQGDANQNDFTQMLDNISDESDFSSLKAYFKAEDIQETASRLLGEHLPDRYRELMRNLIADSLQPQ